VNVRASFRIALDALRVNALRSVLTMLGIVIGVAEVIVMVSLVSGAHDRVDEQIRALGSNLILVRPGSVFALGTYLGRGTQLTITEDDAWAIQREVGAARTAAPFVRAGGHAVFGNLNWATFIQGATPEYLDVREWPLAKGRGITRRDVDGALRVAVLGQTVTDQLFGSPDPVGQVIRVQRVPFTVIGVLTRRGQASWGEDFDDIVLIPLSTAKKKLMGASLTNPRAVNVILVRIRDDSSMGEAERQIRTVLRHRHRLRPDQGDDFFVQNFNEVRNTLDQTTSALAILLTCIASISLLVGGIGIMNIMLVSVTERTREIGVRMAVGAKRRHILMQFLVEALILSLIGGGLGIALGLLAASAITYVVEWRTLVAPQTIVLAFLFSGAVGVFFGFYPARRASRLRPIDALRYE
jgi:putative ABC transport system permease protein